MSTTHDKKVSEPVQVYLDRGDRQRLDRLAGELDTTKSDVLRRGLDALERQLLNPESHPALRIIGIAGQGPDRDGPDYDVARDHDRFLADTEQASWRGKAE